MWKNRRKTGGYYNLEESQWRIRSGAYARNAEKKLEIPAELEEFSCLYCGARMRTEALQAKPVQAEAVEELLAQLPGCITRYPDLHLRIGKKDFFPTFAQYEQDNTPLLLQLDACCAGYPGGPRRWPGMRRP